MHMVHKVCPGVPRSARLQPDAPAGCVPSGAEGLMTDHTGRPKYLQVAGELRRAISAGTYPVGSELPSTARLTEIYGVSTTVVRAAVRELRDEGLVRGQAGKAVYVTAEPDGEPVDAEDLDARLRRLTETVHDALRDLGARVAALEERAGRPD